MNKKLAHWFLFSTAVILFVSASFILLSTLTETVFLELPDGLFAVSSRKIFYIMAGVELVLSAFLLVSQNLRIKLLLAAFVSCNLLIYHAGMAFAGETNLFLSMSTLTHWMPVSPRMLSLMVYGIHGGMFLGSSVFLLADWLSFRKQSGAVSSANHVSPVPVMQNG